jgi:hypothetical protein
VFINSYDLEFGRLCYDACGRYIALKSNLRRIKGIPQNYIIEDETNSKGGTIAVEAVRDLEMKIEKAENAMKCYGQSSFRAAKDLILEGVFPVRPLERQVRRAIVELAISLGFCTK